MVNMHRWTGQRVKDQATGMWVNKLVCVKCHEEEDKAEMECKFPDTILEDQLLFKETIVSKAEGLINEIDGTEVYKGLIEEITKVLKSKYTTSMDIRVIVLRCLLQGIELSMKKDHLEDVIIEHIKRGNQA